MQAELAKIWTNILRYATFALPNLLMMDCEQNGANVFEVIDLINRDYPRGGIASPGLTAGTCLRKDFAFSEERSNAPGMLLAVSRVNESVPLFLVEGLKRRIGDLSGRKVAVLGLAFKRDTDDERDSLSHKLVRLLERELADVAVHDPRVSTPSQSFDEALAGADAVVVATNHSDFDGPEPLAPHRRAGRRRLPRGGSLERLRLGAGLRLRGRGRRADRLSRTARSGYVPANPGAGRAAPDIRGMWLVVQIAGIWTVLAVVAGALLGRAISSNRRAPLRVRPELPRSPRGHRGRGRQRGRRFRGVRPRRPDAGRRHERRRSRDHGDGRAGREPSAGTGDRRRRPADRAPGPRRSARRRCGRHAVRRRRTTPRRGRQDVAACARAAPPPAVEPARAGDAVTVRGRRPTALRAERRVARVGARQAAGGTAAPETLLRLATSRADGLGPGRRWRHPRRPRRGRERDAPPARTSRRARRPTQDRAQPSSGRDGSIQRLPLPDLGGQASAGRIAEDLPARDPAKPLG